MAVKQPKKKAKTSTKAKADNKSKVVAKSGWLRWCLVTSLKLSIVIAFAIAIYVIYLDSKVTRTFDGQKWQIPVQVFGQIPQLSVGAPVDFRQLRIQLNAAGYSSVTKVRKAGQYALSTKRMIIYRKSFDYGEGLESAQVVTLEQENGLISYLDVNNRSVGSARLEPVLIDRIVPESKEDRVLVDLEEVPEQLIDALLLIEDRDYYQHYGIAPLGILRALVANIEAGRTVQGGSTLTQQLVKNMFLTRQKTFTRKINEALMALILEYRYSKDQLLEAYINEVYLGQHYANGIYGFGLAAQFYFDRKIDQLSIAQIATLVGQIKGPSYYDPWRYPERAASRRDLILTLMFDHHLLNRSEFEQAIESPLDIRKTRRVARQNHPAYLQLVKRELQELLTDDAKSSGISVFTGFDIVAQENLYKTAKLALPELERQGKQSGIETAMVVTDYQNGEVRALLGGRDQSYAGFNRAIKANRHIGSLIKPAIYLAALERYDTYHFGTILQDKPLAIEQDNGEIWQPKNYSGKFGGQSSMFDALVKSLNVPTVNLGLDLGVENVVDLLKALGADDEINPHPSMLLGAVNMTPIEVSQMYSTIANGGIYQTNHAINYIVTDDGQTLWRFSEQGQQRLSEQASYLIKYALNQVTKQGTGKATNWLLPEANIAGKTGTSNAQRDSWFVGFDDKQLVTTWMGRDDNKATSFTGSSGALRLYTSYMSQQGVNDLTLNTPEFITLNWFDEKTGNLYQGRCANSHEFPFNNLGRFTAIKCEEKHEEDKSWLEKLFG